MNAKNTILFCIVIAQFCGTSLWFAGNAVMEELTQAFELTDQATANLTIAVQVGFIVGTLVFATLTLVDKYKATTLFMICAFSGGLINLGVLAPYNTFTSLVIIRFATGLCLAGIYPVGMKIAADHFKNGLGKSLGFLVGALVLGTAFPHLVKSFVTTISWQLVIWVTSSAAIIGGFIVYLLVPQGPYSIQSQAIKFNAIPRLFKIKNVRAAAFGYFGHMWELYAFWAFVPLLISHQNKVLPPVTISVITFICIAIGALGCIAGGFVAQKTSSRFVAKGCLLISGSCCILSPLMYELPPVVFYIFLSVWGCTVIADSPQFSTLVATTAPPSLKGTALTIVNSIGFSISIISILLISVLVQYVPVKFVLMLLALGPIIGLIKFQFNFANDTNL